MADISLTASMRSNLLSLQNTQSLMDMTQERLSTGKKVNSAIDNPSSYYTAQSLTNRASDLSALLDSMGQGIQTLKAANEGIETITAYAQQAKSVANSARDIANNMKVKVSSTKPVKEEDQIGDAGHIYIDTRTDKTTTSVTLTGIDTAYTGTTLGGTATFNLNLVVDGEAKSVTVSHTLSDGDATFKQQDIQDALDAAFGEDAFTATLAGAALTLVSNDGQSVMVTGYSKPDNSQTTSDSGQAGGGPTANNMTQDTAIEDVEVVATETFAQLLDKLNAIDDITAEIDPDNGKLVIKASEQTKEAGLDVGIAVGGDVAKKALSGLYGTVETRVSDEKAIEQRNKYVVQYNEILSQIDKVAKDSIYKGINLLQENDMRVIFNEDRSSTLEVKGVDASSKGLGLEEIEKGAWNLDEDVDASLVMIEDSITTLRTMASDFGNYYSIVQNREDFTENVINVLEEGSDKLTLADMNEESANMLALQTRQQLAINSLSLASQASQSVLKLFG